MKSPYTVSIINLDVEGNVTYDVEFLQCFDGIIVSGSTAIIKAAVFDIYLMSSDIITTNKLDDFEIKFIKGKYKSREIRHFIVSMLQHSPTRNLYPDLYINDKHISNNARKLVDDFDMITDDVVTFYFKNGKTMDIDRVEITMDEKRAAELILYMTLEGDCH